MNKRCTLIQTRKSDVQLLKLLLDEDTTFAPMGTGGYKIQEDKAHGGEFHLILFVAQDRTPDGTHYAFLKDGKIWATYMGSWITSLFCRAGINFSSKKVENPTFIEEEMTKRSAR